MSESIESDEFKNKYNKLLVELEKYEISEEDFRNYVYILEEDIRKEIKDSKLMPPYAYSIIIKEAMVYDYNDYVFLELICGFDISKEAMDDITRGGPFIRDFMDNKGNIYIEHLDDIMDDDIQREIMIPTNANARINLTTGYHSAQVDWS